MASNADKFDDLAMTGLSADPPVEFDIEAILGLLKRRWVWTIIVPILSAVAAYAGTFLIQPEFRGSVVVVPSKAMERLSGHQGSFGSALGGLSSLSGLGLSFGGGASEGHLAELKSRDLILELIRQKGLKRILFPDRWDEGSSRWIAELSVHPDENGAPGDWETYEEVSDKIEVSSDLELGTISLHFYWSDPEGAAELSNALMALLNTRTREREMQASETNIDYLRQSLGTIDKAELRNATTRIMQMQLERYLVVRGVTDFPFRVIDRAIPPNSAVRPRRAVIAGLGLVIAAIISVGGVLYTARRQLSR